MYLEGVSVQNLARDFEPNPMTEQN